MILINKEQFSHDKLAKRLGIVIPLDKIRKKPLYEINPAFVFKDRANGPGATKHRYSMEFPAVFRTQLTTGEDVEIRYCTTRNPDPKTHGNSEKYSPRMVEFEGKAEYVTDDKDRAVYFWLHFFCKTSPFRDQAKPYEYELVDDDAKAKDLIATLTLKGQATSHASGLEGDELLITAKGMKIPGASSMETEMVKATLMQYANDHPAEYLNHARSQVNHVNGLIYDSIDKGIFKLEHAFNTKRWMWGLGPKAGEVITEMSSAVQDDNEALVQYIAQTPGVVKEIIPVLINTIKNMKAKTNVETAMEGINIFDELKGSKPVFGAPMPQQRGGVINQPPPMEFSGSSHVTTGSLQNTDPATSGPMVILPNEEFNKTAKDTVDEMVKDETFEVEDDDQFKDDFEDEGGNDTEVETSNRVPLPANFADSQAYMFEKIGKKTPALASELNKGIQSGEITHENIDMKMEEFKTK